MQIRYKQQHKNMVKGSPLSQALILLGIFAWHELNHTMAPADVEREAESSLACFIYVLLKTANHLESTLRDDCHHGMFLRNRGN